ncbi:MAG: TdeIII family type II restriction endonuclease [Caldisericum sp.]
MTEEQKTQIKNHIKKVIVKKLRAYKPETQSMPFHYKLLGEDRMALFSFIHSLNTTFGTSIFESVAELLAKSKFVEVKKQYEVGKFISSHAQKEIQNIINELATGRSKPNKLEEIERIRRVAQSGEQIEVNLVKADLFIIDKEDKIYLFDIKTAKPNISNFKDFKRTLLEWIAVYLYKNINAEVYSYIAIPYNPYESEYNRWTLNNMLDSKNELMVGKEFWNFLGGEGAYEHLLDCFEQVGVELRPILDEHFSNLQSRLNNNS